MAQSNSSWKVGSWTTPTTTVTTTPVPSEVSPESRSQISDSITGQFASFIQDSFPTFIEFVKAYYQSQELKGYCLDIINNWADYYNLDNYGNLVTETTTISTVTTSSTTVDVTSTRDFPSEGLILIDDEIIYYQSKGATLFNTCSRGFDAVKAIGEAGDFIFSSTTPTEHVLGSKVVNLNNLFPLFMLGQFKELLLSTYPKNFYSGLTESTVIKRIKDFYASKGSTRSFQFVLRTIFGVESEVSYPRDRIFKPSDAYYTSREVIRCVAITGDPTELVGEVLYQEADANDPSINAARIYVKGVVEVFTQTGSIFEVDVDTNNALGTFVTPYKSILAADLTGSLSDDIITVDSTLGWPEKNGRFRIEDEIISYTDKTVNQFLGCNRARESTLNVAHDAGQEVFAAYKIYGKSNVDGSEIQLKVYGGTRGVNISKGGKYYLPQSKVTTPLAPGFDSLDPIWSSFVYNVRRALRGVTATLGTPDPNGAVRVTVTTKEKHQLRRDDKVRILNAEEDIYNNQHDVIGIVDNYIFEFVLSSTPAAPILAGKEFFIAREFAYGSSDYSYNAIVSKFIADTSNTYKSSTDCIVASTGIPSHKIGPFAAADIDPGNQRYLKRIPLQTSTKSTKTPTPIGQVGIGANGVPLFSYKGSTTRKYGGLKSITKNSGGDGYDIQNPPTVEFEPDYKLATNYASGIVVKWGGKRYQSKNVGQSSNTLYPTHTSGNVTLGTIEWTYLGLAASATAEVDGRVISINVTNGGGGYTSEPSVSISGGGASSSTQATAVAQITEGKVTGITVTNSGSGYTQAAGLPTIIITGGNGAGATATAVVRGPLKDITITAAGSQYTYEPVIKLISGSGAVAYPSILNGKIESAIVTFGGSGYFGAPDVVITGDGVGATAFAQVDLSQNIVTGIVVTNKGIGYTVGNTNISIVYPGTGASFTTKLTELTFNESATATEVGQVSFNARKVTDQSSGAVMEGENSGIYGGEYGYLYNPKNLRYYLADNIEPDTDPNNPPWKELNPTKHSPIIGWAYDGHPIYGPYGYEDPENQNPYNAYSQPGTSYRLKTSRDALLSGLADPMGTFIEDYEYVEGLGGLDQYNGRFCVTPEFPDGVYAYFCTIDGISGNPKFPYFVGPNFYSEADEVNWDGNGLQKNFTEDSIRYKAPYIGTDNITTKRKQLDNKVDFVLALEDTTTLITLETGEILQYVEDGIGYFSYYPVIRGGIAESLTVSSTNQYSSANIDQYLVEGGGTGYKVNDRLLFDNSTSGGEGVSAAISAVTGTTVSSLNYAVDDDDVVTATLTTSDKHYLVGDDQLTITIADNSSTRSLNTKIINNKYHFEYFDLVSMKLIGPWTNSTAYAKNDLVYVANRVYKAAAAGTSDSGAGNAPTHLSGTASDGTLSWTYVRTRTDGNLVQGGWSSITGGSGYENGTYTDVPLTTNNSGRNAKATIVISGGAITTVTITEFGTAYNVGDTISASDQNLGNGGGSSFSITLTETLREAVCHTSLAHQVAIGDTVNISGVSPSTYDKTDYEVIRTETLRRFTVKRNHGSTAAATVTSADVYVQEPKLELIDGHSYTFDTSDASNVGKTLAFTLDPANTDIFTYKNISAETSNAQTGQQTSITILMTDLPGIFYYFDIQGTIAGSYLTVMNEPLSGTNIVKDVTDLNFTYIVGKEPESGYTSGINYVTTSIYPTGGIGKISIGDSGRNYSSLPKLTGSTRSGSGATAVATISGSVSGVTIANMGSGYNPAGAPVAYVTLPDFVDLTLTEVLGSGSFAKDEIVISEPVLGAQTARGKVINWDPTTSILRIQPLRNNLKDGAGNFSAATRGWIMYTPWASNNARGKVYSSDAEAKVTTVGGIHANVQAVIPSSGPNVGKLESVSIIAAGSNYRAAPTIDLDDPTYGLVNTVSITTQSSTNYTTGTYTGVAQKSVAPTGGTNVEFTVIVNGAGTIESITVTDGGSTYALGDVITISGASMGGTDVTHDATVTVDKLTHLDPAITNCVLNASIDAITVTNTGSGYLSAPNVDVSGGSGINAKFNSSIVNEGVSSINIEDGGTLYQNAPVVNITQKTGKGASLLLKSSDLGKILKIGGDNITFNYSHDRTLKPELNTTYNLQLTRTQVIDYLDVTNGGQNFVSQPTIVLTGGSGSLYQLEAIVENEVIQSVEVRNGGRGFLSAPVVNARVTHNWVALMSNSTLNFPYNTKMPTGTAVTLNEVVGTFPAPLAINTTYYVVAANGSNGLANNQVKLATSEANAIANTPTTITFTSAPVGDANGLTTFTLDTTDLGDVITAYMRPATFLVGERVYQGASTASYTAFGYVKNWDPAGRVVSVEISEGEFKVGEPIFGEESSSFGSIHAFDRADAVFEVSPISISSSQWERTTGFLDINEQRLYDSNRFQEFSYEISSPINIRDWKNPLKFAAHPAGFKVVGTQILSQASKKSYRGKPTLDLLTTSSTDWWVPGSNSISATFNGLTYVTPKPSAKNTGKLATINNFALGKPDYTAAVPTEVQIFGRQLLDIQKILTCVSYKVDDITSRDISFDGASSSVVDLSNNRITLTNHGLVENQTVTFRGDIGGLTTGTVYYVDVIDANTISLKSSLGGSTVVLSSLSVGTHTFVSCNTDGIVANNGSFFNPTNVVYTPADGNLVIHSAGHGLNTNNKISIADDALTLTCLMDNNATNHTYPRSTDPIGHGGKILDITATTNDTFTVNVGSTAAINKFTVGIDGVNTQFTTRVDNTLITTKISKTSVKSQFLVIIDGIVQNPNNYTFASDVITFSTAPKVGSSALVMYYDRASYTSSFQLDQIGDELKTLDTGMSGSAAHTYVGGTATNAVTVVSDSNTQKNVTNATYTPATGLLELTIGSHSYTTSDTIQIADSSLKFTCAADNHASTHAYPRPSDEAFGATLAITAETATTITVQVNTNLSPVRDTSDGLTAGTGYADGTYANIPLFNKIGTGVGATGDIVVVDGGVKNVVLNNPGNGYTDNDILGISPIGKPLTNSYVPSTASYTPSTGVLELTVGEHTLTAPTTTTVTDADYNPTTGIMTVTVVAHGLKAGDQVKFADGSLKLSCAFGGASGTAAQKDYPRNTDYASDRWLEVSNITTNTFDVTVLDTIPSTNTDAHSFVSAVASGLSIATSTVKFSNNSLNFTCTQGGGVHSYPRSSDPISGKNVPVDAISSTTFTVNALNGTAATNTTTHTFDSLATYQYQPSYCDYDATTGIMEVWATAHGLSNGDFVQFAADGLTFKCSRDGYATNHTYPRSTDPAAGNWLNVFEVSTNNFKVNIGQAVEKAMTPTSATFNASTGALSMSVENHGLTAATSHTATGASFNTTTGIVTIEVNNHGFKAGDKVKLKDGAITFSCTHGSGGQTAYPRSTDPISGKWITIRAVNPDTFDIQCLDDTPCTNTTTHTFVSGLADGILYATSFVSIDDDALTFTCSMDDDFSRHSYPAAGDRSSKAVIGVESVTSDTFTVDVGASPEVAFTPTAATYTATTGDLQLTIGSHSLEVGNSINIDVNSLMFRCDMENDGTLASGNLTSLGATLHNYPRVTDPAAKTNQYITATTGTTITVNVGTSPIVNYQPTGAALNLANGDLDLTVGGHKFRGYDTFTPTDIAYDPATGVATLTIKGHTINKGDYVQIAKESLTFTCTAGAGNHSYPRVTDPAYRSWLQVLAVTNDTIQLNFYVATGATGQAHTFVSASDNCVQRKGDTIKLADGGIVMSCDNGGVSNQSYPRTDTISYTPTDADYDPATGIMTVTHGGGAAAFVNGDQVKFDDSAIVFTCTQGGGTHAYPRATDPASGRWLTIWDADDTTFKVQVLDSIPSTNVTVHTFDSAVSNGLKKKKDWAYDRPIPIKSVGYTSHAVTAAVYVPSTGVLTSTVAGHGFSNGDYVKVNQGALKFTCNKDSNATVKSYPTLEDPNYDEWMLVSNVTTDTFDINVGVAGPNGQHAHTFVPEGKLTPTVAAYDPLTGVFTITINNHGFIAGDEIKIDDDTFRFTCNEDFHTSFHNYPRSTDPISGQWVKIYNVTTNTFDIQVLNSVPSTNTTAHTFISAVSNSITRATVKKQTGVITINTNNRDSAITHQYAHSFVSAGATAVIAGGNYTHTFIQATTNAIKSGGDHTHTFVNATPGSVKTGFAHQFVSASANSVTRSLVQSGGYEYDKLADAGRLIRENLDFIATTAYGRMMATNSTFVVPSFVKCIRDTKLITEAVANNIEFGGNDATYDAAKYYVGTVHLQGEEDQTVLVFNHARDIAREVMRNISVTTNHYTEGAQYKDLTITNDSGNATYDTNDCTDVASAITTLTAIVTQAVGTTSGGAGNLTGITRTSSSNPEFQVEVGTVAFDGTDKIFSAKVAGSNYALPASDNFLIFLNSILQIKGSTEAYTYTGSTISFTEAPTSGMDFYGFYFGKLQLLDTIAPFFDNARKTFVMTLNSEPFSLQSDNSSVEPANNVMIFLNGVFQEPGVAYQLNGSIIEFFEAPRAGSTCSLYIYVGSAEDIFISNTFNSLDPNDRVMVKSEGEDRLLATVSSATSVDTYEYTGLRPTVANFECTINNGKVDTVSILDGGSNYEVPPILYFQGGSGTGASAETVVQSGSGTVTSIVNLNGGAGYLTPPTVFAVHPVHIERKSRDRIISNTLALANTYLASSISAVDTTLTCKNIYFDVSQNIGFPDEGEVLIPYYNPATDSSGNVIGWTCERILYGSKNTSANTLTVATGGRGYGGTTAFAISIQTGTYSSSGTVSTITTSAAHNLTTGMSIYLDHTSGDGFDGAYKVTVTAVDTFTVEYPFSRTTSGNVSLLPEVRLRSL